MDKLNTNTKENFEKEVEQFSKNIMDSQILHIFLREPPLPEQKLNELLNGLFIDLGFYSVLEIGSKESLDNLRNIFNSNNITWRRKVSCNATLVNWR